MRKGVKILVITGVFPPAPIPEADHVARLCAELAHRGYEIDVLARQGAQAVSDLYTLHPIMPHWRWSDSKAVHDTARALNPDLVLIWFIGTAYDFHPMITFAPTSLKKVLPQAAIVTQITAPVGARPKAYPLGSRLIRRAIAMASGGDGVDYSYGSLFRDSDRLIVMATTHLERFSLAWDGVREKTTVVPPPPLIRISEPGVETRQRGREALGVREGETVFAYFGRLYRRKGLETLLAAFPAVRERIPAARLAIIGGVSPDWFHDGWSVETLHAQARQLGIADAISWSGEFHWESDLGSACLRAADFAVLPFDEGAALNNSSISACAAHGLPIITTYGSLAEPEFVDGVNLLLCQPQNAPQLADAMVRLAGDQQLQNRLREGSEALVKRYFNWDSSVTRTIGVLDKALASARRKP